LNHRDSSATSFADLFAQVSNVRPAANMPLKLNRPSLDQPVSSVVAGIPVDPADEPLDPLIDEWVEGFAELSASSNDSG
jgi:hypothetical protein